MGDDKPVVGHYATHGEPMAWVAATDPSELAKLALARWDLWQASEREAAALRAEVARLKRALAHAQSRRRKALLAWWACRVGWLEYLNLPCWVPFNGYIRLLDRRLERP